MLTVEVMLADFNHSAGQRVQRELYERYLFSRNGAKLYQRSGRFFLCLNQHKSCRWGDAGSSILEDLIAQDLKGVEFIVMDTDPQALNSSTAPLKLQLGKLMAGYHRNRFSRTYRELCGCRQL